MSAQSFHTFSRNMRGGPRRVKRAMLTAEDEITLVSQMNGMNGEPARVRTKARETLIEAYYPLAHKMAHNAAIRGIVPLDDLKGEAIIALAIAIDKFDPNRGARISTPASIEIKSYLMRYIMDNSGPTRLGTNFDDKKIFMRLRSMISNIERESGRTVHDSDLQQIADDLGVKVTAVQRMLPRIYTNDTAIASTDSTPDEDNGATVQGRGAGAQIAIEGGQGSREVAMDVSRIFRLMEGQVSSKWTGRNRDIILAYLRGEAHADNLEKMAQKYDISVERVRQIWREGREDLRVFLQVNENIESVNDISL
jgi:RNA polymerase sigma-32 factor